MDTVEGDTTGFLRNDLGFLALTNVCDTVRLRPLRSKIHIQQGNKVSQHPLPPAPFFTILFSYFFVPSHQKLPGKKRRKEEEGEVKRGEEILVVLSVSIFFPSLATSLVKF